MMFIKDEGREMFAKRSEEKDEGEDLETRIN